MTRARLAWSATSDSTSRRVAGFEDRWLELAHAVMRGYRPTRREALLVLQSRDDELLSVLQAAHLVRRRLFGNEVRLHIIHSARTGGCTEDCGYCAQARGSSTPKPVASIDEGLQRILDGAATAARMGAVRYCVVASGRGASETDVDGICRAVELIKRRHRIEVCTSLGVITPNKLRRLAGAGVDRYNHNLETSDTFFPEICSTHSYADRVATARAVKKVGMALCCGGIIGLGESLEDRVSLAFETAALDADSVPVNFFDPRPGSRLGHRPKPSAAECLRALAMFRLVHPRAELRAAGGREACLGPLQALALFAANSLFTGGYLTTAGQAHPNDVQMIEAAGFRVGSLTQGD